jgi:hypothetical protein
MCTKSSKMKTLYVHNFRHYDSKLYMYDDRSPPLQYSHSNLLSVHFNALRSIRVVARYIRLILWNLNYAVLSQFSTVCSGFKWFLGVPTTHLHQLQLQFSATITAIWVTKLWKRWLLSQCHCYFVIRLMLTVLNTPLWLLVVSSAGLLRVVCGASHHPLHIGHSSP